MDKKIAVAGIAAIVVVVVTLLVAQPIMSQEETVSPEIDDARITAVLDEILAGQQGGEVSPSLNGLDNGQASSTSTDTATANPWVSNVSYSTAVTKVKESRSGSENMYWMNYSPTKANKQLDFIILYMGNGKSVIDYEWQHFDFTKLYPSGYSGGTSTPFGVTYWGGDPIIGPAYLVVFADGVYQGYYAFEVVK